MSLLYTMMPLEVIFGTEAEEKETLTELELNIGEVRLLVQPLSGGRAVINRIISTNPNDYLNPTWQPGSIINSSSI